MENQANSDTRLRAVQILTLVGLISVAALMLQSGRVASAQSVAPSWSFTGSLSVARIGNSATLLSNGKVLVAGGSQPIFSGMPLNSSELYDPTTGTWSLTGNLNLARAGHTATLLSNGKVLVVGGSGECVISVGCSFHNSAELYDPATGTWSLTGTLNLARAGNTATLLADGKVLVVAGVKDTCIPFCSILNSAELYDPTTGTWSVTGSLNLQRSSHTATLLPSGKVLVTAGFYDNSAELYDPGTETWSRTGSLNTGRSAHSATLLSNGNVLVAGGIGNCNTIDCFPVNGAELYDPVTGTWSVTGNINSANGPAALLPNGKVLAVGGDAVYGYGGNSTELFDPGSGTWSVIGSLNATRTSHTVTALPNGKVLVVGGSGDNTAELYDPGANPIDDALFFVHQQYLDLLNREPDTGGLAYWTDRVTECGSDARCIHERRIAVSAAFFIEREFQETGYYVYRLYKASFGRQPSFEEFMLDRGQVVTGPQGEASRQAFAEQWVQRATFQQAFPAILSNTEFVNRVFEMSGLTASIYDGQRQEQIAAMNAGRSRALALLDVIEIPDFKNIPDPNSPRYDEIRTTSQYNPAFVLMQYFGYLRRDPDENGYLFWLDVLNNRVPGNFRSMVCGFLTSTEYQMRFGITVTRSNRDCGP